MARKHRISEHQEHLINPQLEGHKNATSTDPYPNRQENLELTTQDCASFFQHMSRCHTEAFREGDISRLAPFELVGPGRYSKQVTRFLFLHAISIEAPSVWEDLRDGPYKMFSELDHAIDRIQEAAQIIAYKETLPDRSILDVEVRRLQQNQIGKSGHRLTYHLLSFLINLRRDAWLGRIPGWKPTLIPEDSNWALAGNPELLPKDFGFNEECSRQDVFWYWPALRNAEQAYAYELVPLRHSLLEWVEKWNIAAEWILDSSVQTMRLWQVYGVRPDTPKCEVCQNNCSMHCRRLLHSFDSSMITSDTLDINVSLPGIVPGWLPSKGDYLHFIEERAREYLNNPYSSIAGQSNIETLLLSILKKAKAAYRQATKQCQQNRDMIRINPKTNLWDDLRYAVMSLVKKLTPLQIADKENPSSPGAEDAIGRAVRRRLKELDLSRAVGSPRKR